MAERPRSLGFATDLALVRLQGGRVEEAPGHLVVRMPANPTYHWGNCLVLDGSPRPGSLAGWVDTFRAAHPHAGHVALGVDGPGVSPDPVEAADLGLEVERDIVLTASGLVDEPRRAPDVECRAVAVADDAAWAALVELEVRAHGRDDPEGHRTFVRRRLDAVRSLTASGHGGWFAAYTSGGEPVATLGLFRATPGVARYQSVLTDERFRRQGVAGALLRYAGRRVLDRPDVHTLVIVADPDGPAIGLYRAAGFDDHGEQWALYRAPDIDWPG